VTDPDVLDLEIAAWPKVERTLNFSADAFERSNEQMAWGIALIPSGGLIVHRVPQYQDS